MCIPDSPGERLTELRHQVVQHDLDRRRTGACVAPVLLFALSGEWLARKKTRRLEVKVLSSTTLAKSCPVAQGLAIRK